MLKIVCMNLMQGAFLTVPIQKVSNYIVNPIKKVLSVRIYLPAGTYKILLGPVKKNTLYIQTHRSDQGDLGPIKILLGPVKKNTL